jgi:hypothetical protein
MTLRKKIDNKRIFVGITPKQGSENTDVAKKLAE